MSNWAPPISVKLNDNWLGIAITEQSQLFGLIIIAGVLRVKTEAVHEIPSNTFKTENEK
jgi:hypothetical protein